MKPHLDPLRAFLLQHGAPPHVVEGGLPGLLLLWESFAHDVWRGYTLGLDDYLNDLDVRTLLDACLAQAACDATFLAPQPGAPLDLEALRARIASADARLRSATVARRQCLWGEAVAQRRGWNAATHWWYFRVPKVPGPTLRDDLSPG